MACKYYVDGKQLTEIQFKELLNDGLLDQIMVNQNLEVPGFEINEDVISETLGKSVGPLKLRVRYKINKQVNNLKDSNLQSVQRNPKTVIEESNNQIGKKNKNKLIFVTKVGGDLKYGKSLSSKSKVAQDILESKTNILNNMQEGKIYMLVPSSYGLYPALLQSNFLGQTKIAPKVEKVIKSLFDITDKKEFKKVTTDISKVLFQTNITKENDKIKIETTKANKEKVSQEFDNAEDIVKFILGEYDSKGNLIGTETGLLAHVNHNNLNSKNSFSNSYYADNNFVSTDLYSEGGNFFNSSSFVMDAFKATEQVSKVLVEVLQSPITGAELSGNKIKTKEQGVKEASAVKENSMDDTFISNKKVKDVKEYIADIEKRRKESLDLNRKNYNKEYTGNRLWVYKEPNGMGVEKLSTTENTEKDINAIYDAEIAALAHKLPEPGPGDVKEGLFTATPEEREVERFVAEQEAKEGFNINDYDTGLEGEDLDIKTRLERDPKLLKKEGDQLELTFEGEEYYTDATAWSKEEEVAWLKEKLGKETVEKNFTFFDSLEDLKEYLPEESYEMLLEARKHGKFTHGLFTKAAVHISNNAFQDTGFHEAFHVVFNLALPLEQRLNLMEEAIDKYNIPKEASLKEIEEVLADKFMEYVRAEEEIKVPSSKIAKFFKSLWRTIKTFFNRNNKISINTLFEDIQLGEYANKIHFNKTDFSKINAEDIKLRQTNPNTLLDSKLEPIAFRYMEYKLFQILDNARKTNPLLSDKSDPEVIAELAKEGGINRVFGSLMGTMIADAQANKNKDISNLITVLNAITDKGQAIKKVKIGNNTFPVFKGAPTELMLKFNRYLRTKGININLDSIEEIKYDLDEQTGFNEELENTSIAERWQQAHIEINPFETLSQIVRRKLGTIQKQIIVNGKRKPVTNILGAPVNYSEQEVYSYLGQNITDSYSPDKMIKKLNNLKKKKPFIEDVLNMVQGSASFKTSLYTTLASKTFQKFLMVYEDNGNYRTFYSNRKTIDKLIKENFIANFLVESNDLFEKYTEGEQKGQRNFEKIDFDKVIDQIDKINNIKEESANAATLENKNKVLKDLNNFLIDNNLPISENQLNDIWNPVEGREESSWKNIKNLIDNTVQIFEELSNEKNPFLVLRADKKTGYKSILEKFVRAVKPGFEKELIAAFRNGNNKTVYSIQYSNHLNKLISKLKTKEGILEYKDKISKDPLLSSMPLINDLIEEEEPTAYMDKLEVVILDSLGRKGKSSSVPYDSLSDVEMGAMEIAAYYNAQYDENKDYGYYKLPIPSDSSILPLIKGKKFSFDEIVDRLLSVAIAEGNRINSFKNLPEDSELLKIPNYKDKAGKYNILSFLEGRVTSQTSPSEIRVIIEDHLNGEFLELQKEKYKQAGIILNYKKGPDGEITFADNVITKKKKQTATEFFKDYMWNSYYMNTQMTTIFGGDPAFYKNTGDYQKRYKQIISPGTYTNFDLVDAEYQGMIFKDEFVPTKSEVVDNIINLLDSSNLPKQQKTELKAFWDSTRKEKDPKNHHNITDAATFISIDRAVNILVSLDRFTPQHEEAAERIRKGIEKPEDAALFTVLKPFMFTEQNVDGTIVPIQIKNSEVLLTKAFAYRKDDKGNFMYPKLIKAYELLNGPDSVDFIAFESAVKVGGLGQAVKDGKVEFNELELVEGNYELVGNRSEITLNHEDWRIQQENPEHYIDESGNFGSQVRVLAIADMDMNGNYNIGGKNLKGREVAKLYQDIVVDNIRTSFEEVESMFLDEDGEIDYPSITRHIKEEALRRNLGEEYYKALELIDEMNGELATGKKVPTLPLWHPLQAYKVESLMNSFFKNNVTRQKFKGGQMVNATSYGVSDTLEFSVDKDGNYQMEALLPWWSRKFFPKDKNGNVNIEALPEELKNIIGYRIPTEDKYSIFNIKVKGFTDSAAGNQIILPYNATTQAGLDFDIDKLFMMMPEYKIDSKRNAVYKKYLDKNSSLDDVVDNIIDSKKVFNNFLEQLPDSRKKEILSLKERSDEQVYKMLSSKKEFKQNEEFINNITRRQELRAELDAEINESRKKSIRKELRNLKENISELDLFDYRIEEAKQYKSLKENIKDYLESIEISSSMYEDYNSTATRNNKILEIMIGIMENKHTALSILNVGNFDNLKEMGNRMRLAQISPKANKKLLELKAKGKKADRDTLNKLVEELDSNKDFNINYPSTQLTLFTRNMTGKKLLGIFANNNTNHAKAQFTDLQLVAPVVFNKKQYYDLNKQEVNGVRISRSLATMLAAAADNAKDPIADSLNMNMYTGNIIAMLSRLGVDEKTIFSFVNQPAIKERTKLYFNNQQLSKEKRDNILRNAFKEYKNKAQDLVNNKEFEKINKELNINLKDLDAALDANKSKEYYITQYKALKAFKLYETKANFLNNIVQTSRVDTTSVGPSNGDNYVMINRQERLLNKIDPSITGYEALLFNQGDLKINPGFNKYGWLKPVTILNKVFPSIGTIDSTTGNVNYSTLGKIKNLFSKSKEFGLTAAEAREVDTAFMTYLGSQLPFFSHKNAEKVLEKTPEELLKYKNNNPDSRYSPLLDSLFVKDADKTIKIRRIEFYNTGKTSLDKEAARRSWEEMLTSENKTDRDLAFSLVKYSYFSNGYSFGPFSFFDLIPVEFWKDSFARKDINKQKGLLDISNNSFTNLLTLSLKQLENSTLTNDYGYINQSGPLYNFIKQFAQNNAETGNIIPFFDNNKFIKNNILKLSKEQLPIFSHFLKVLDKGVIKLFELDTNSVGVVNEYGEQNLIYNRINTLGTSNFVKEYSYDQELDTSVVNKITKITKEQKEEFKPKTKDPLDPSIFMLSDISEDIKDDDISDIDLTMLPGTPIKTKIVDINTNYLNYTNLAKEKGQELMSKTKWDNSSSAEKITAIEQLKKC